VCITCGGTEFAETISDVVCKNCGTVVDRIFQGNQYMGQDGQRRGAPESRRGHSTYFRVSDVFSKENKDKYIRLKNVENCSYDAIQENKTRLLTMLEQLGLTENEKNDILYELRKKYASEKRNGKKVTNIFLLAAAITLKQVKNREKAISINDIVNLFKSHGCKLSSKAVRDYILKNGISYKITPAREFVPKYMAKLKTNPSLVEKLKAMKSDDELAVEKMLTTIEKIALRLAEMKTYGRRPSVFSVSCIYVATSLVGERYLGESLFTKEEISRLCEIPSTTLREHCKFVKNQIKFKI